MPHIVSPFYIPLPVGLGQKDFRGRRGEFTQVRDLRIAEQFRIAGSQFIGTTIDTNFWTSTVSGAAAANTQATGLLTAAGGTDNAGHAMLRSARTARFIFANPMVWRGALRAPTVVVANSVRTWGVFTHTAGVPQNGFYFSLSAAGVLSVVRATGASPTAVASGSFNGEVTSYTLDTNVHAFEIHYFVMQVQFYIDDVLIHTLTPTTAALEATALNLPICFGVLNTAASAGATLQCWATNTSRLGREQTSPRSYRQSGTTAGVVLKYGPGQLHQVNVSAVSNNATITLYDNTAASGTVLWTSGAMGTNTTPFTVDLHEIPFETGLTIVIATANCDCVVAYE